MASESDVQSVNIAVCDCANGEVALYWKVSIVVGTESEWVKGQGYDLKTCSWATFKSVREVIL